MFDIITDSACDLTPETAAILNIEIIPFYVSLDGEHYRKAVSYTHLDVYKRQVLRKRLACTFASALTMIQTSTRMQWGR